MRKALLTTAILLIAYSAPSVAAADWAKVDQVFGRPGMEQPGGIHRYSFPRSDLKVTLDAVAIKPALALGSWAAFQPIGDQTMVMGDLVLTQSEVNPVMSRLIANGFTITALHNHLLRSSPATMYMHISGRGDATRLAQGLRDALGASQTPLGPPPPAAPPGPIPGLDSAALDGLMGAKGKVSGGTYQFSFPRAEKVMVDGMETPPPMGVATAINFEPTGGGKAAVSRDFVLVAREVNPVLQALRASGIEVTALHNHMLDDEPRLFFVHFWANKDAASLARGLRAALDKMNLRR